jgi:hypothetical protein
VSFELPGALGIISRMGLVGYACAAASVPIAMAAVLNTPIKTRFMDPSTLYCSERRAILTQIRGLRNAEHASCAACDWLLALWPCRIRSVESLGASAQANSRAWWTTSQLRVE